MGDMQIAATIINVIPLEYITHHICSKHPRHFIIQMAGNLEEGCILHKMLIRMGIGKADIIAHSHTANLKVQEIGHFPILSFLYYIVVT